MIGDFSANTIYKTIGSGFDSIGYELAKGYLKHEGSNIWTENKLITFAKNEDATIEEKYKLTFLNVQSNTYWHVYANKIILAMPRRSLELLDQNNFFFNINKNKELNQNIRSVIMEPAFKILMGFEYAWWKSLGIDSGHSITDLPMRQCYYFGTDNQNGHSMLLGSYGDMNTETFWKALSDDEKAFMPRLNFAKLSRTATNAINQVQASQLMVDELLNQLRELHGNDVHIPAPYVTWFKDWTDDPFGAGYHAWKAGYKVNEVMPYMRKPLADEEIHICGEAYSDLQGWIEGAFCEAEKMLEEHFGLNYPEWLEKGYYLGW
jgi:monoamine oxidase